MVFDKEKLETLKERALGNSWYKFFKTIDSYKIETWIDFEKEIENLIKKVLQILNNINADHKKYTAVYQDIEEGYIYVINQNIFDSDLTEKTLNIFGFTKEKLLRNTINESLLYNLKYIFQIKGKIQYFKIDIFIDDIYESLKEFISIFNDYLVLIVQPFYDCFNEEKKENFLIRTLKTLMVETLNRYYSIKLMFIHLIIRHL